MADLKVRVKVEGGDKIARKLQMIAEEYAKKHMRECALQAAEVIRKETVRRLGDSNIRPRVRTGTLRDNIEKEVRKQTKARVEIYVGPGKEAWYGDFVERGHALVLPSEVKTARRLRRSARKLGEQFTWHKMVPPYPFLRPAFEEKHDEATEVFEREIRKRLRLW